MDLTLVIILLYLGVMIVLGLFVKRARDSEDFSIARHSLGTFAIVAALVMTHFGGGLVLGGAELGYTYGWYGLIYGFSAALGLLFLGVFLARKINEATRKDGIKTVPSLLLNRFGDKKIAFAAALLSIFYLIGLASAQLFAATKIFDVLGLSPMFSTAVVTIVVMLISTKGMAALAKSGKINLIIGSIGAIAAILLVYSVVGPAQRTVGFTSMPSSYLLAILIPTVLCTMIGQDFHQKIYSTKSLITARKACLYSGIILLLLSIFPVIVGMKSASLFDIPAVESMPKFIVFALPSLFKGLFIAAILAAIIGSCQSVVTTAATQVSEDIFKQFFNASTEKLGSVCMLSALIISLVSFIIAIFSSSIINNIVFAYTLYAAGMFIPVMAAFYLKDPWKLKKSIFIIPFVGILIVVLSELNIIALGIPSIISSLVFSLFTFLIMLSLVRGKNSKDLYRKTTG